MKAKKKTKEMENPEYACSFSAFDADETGFEYEMKDANLFDTQKELEEIDTCEAIYFEAIEFPWVFHGHTAKSFIGYLEEQSKNVESRLFSNQIIQHIIMFQWSYFRTAFIKFRFIPFMIYFGIIIFYITMTHSYETTDNVGPDGQTHPW